MNFSRIGAYLRQPTTLFALSLILGDLVATWFNTVSAGASYTVLIASLPLLVSDNSGIITALMANKADLEKALNAVAAHKDIGPTAAKVIADAVPASTILAAATSTIASSTAEAAPKKSSAASAVAGVMLLGLVGTSLMACGSDQLVQRQQSVYGLSLSDAAAAQLAADYEKNPAADPAVVAKLKPAFQTAHDQIKPLDDAAAKGDPLSEAEVEAAQDALDAARKLLPASK
ncbi:hypothetical protein [Acetobacter oryzifermentans]|uniref:Uncharacterized protein n=1 Tax=Acetobacter oryzifermentans TaxID=1633874 RepID=A0ABM6AHE7_9PROT|nr:hypothetical protein [Acetobacter oryzifermentans]ANA13071.1 hypothetical protein WG31_02835 [Acetobacter oryzifermentans]